METTITRYIGESTIELPVYGILKDAAAAGKLVTDVLQLKYSSTNDGKCFKNEVNSVTLSHDAVMVSFSIMEGTTVEQLHDFENELTNVVHASTGFLTDVSKMHVRLHSIGLNVGQVDVVSFVGTRQCIDRFVVKHGLPGMFDPTEPEVMTLTSVDGATVHVSGFVVSNSKSSFEFVGSIVGQEIAARAIKQKKQSETNAQRALRDLQRLGIKSLDPLPEELIRMAKKHAEQLANVVNYAGLLAFAEGENVIVSTSKEGAAQLVLRDGRQIAKMMSLASKDNVASCPNVIALRDLIVDTGGDIRGGDAPEIVAQKLWSYVHPSTT